MFKKIFVIFILTVFMFISFLPNKAFAGITEIKLDKNTIVVKPGDSFDLSTIKVTAIDDINGDKDVTNSIIWGFEDQNQQIALLNGTILSIKSDADVSQNVVLLAKYVDDNIGQTYTTELTVYLNDMNGGGNNNNNSSSDRGPLKDIVIAQNLPEITVNIINNTIQLYCYNIYNDGSFMISNEQINWSTSDENIATVDNNGIITFTSKKGIVVITAKYGDLNDSITFYDMENIKNIIIKQNLKDIEINYDNNTTKLDVIEVYDDDSFMEINSNSVLWSSNNNNVAVVDKNGLVKFTGNNGSVVITAALGNLSDSITFIYNNGSIISENKGKSNENIISSFGVITSSGDITTLKIDETKAITLLQGTTNKVVVFDIGDIMKTSKKVIEIPISVFNKAEEMGKQIRINVEGASLVLSKDNFINNYSTTSIVAEISDNGKPNASNYVPISNAIDISIKSDSGNVALTKPVEVTLNISKADDPRKVAVYYYNPTTNQCEYVGGKIDKKGDTITFNATHFSQYAALEYDKTFDDIKDNWAKDDIEVLASRHIVEGMTDTQYEPSKTVTRAEFTAMILRLLNIKEEAYSGEFSDVKSGDWYANTIEAAYKAGIIEGDGKNMRPNDSITREEMTAIAMRAYEMLTSYKEENIGATSFNDDKSISDWAKNVVANATKLGIVNGEPNNVFAPKGIATRAEAAAIIYGLLEKSGNI
ncbi:S-layer homology domain-containing protein [Thermoanaerobacterium thermosaccharolyticum]|uniref:S-layer homology domain-containing protein n=1 Tax=Thermoanaerobacterium thermosaccharolyticum TaxID=1517 RepID=UPI003D2C7031